ncbi:MAG: PEP-CTERM sorting domain-containing protein [Acidobacteria bacterium]|nr:PEP-CTERM sorting domain-containing protein [Acidobacteriota bacterium]
MSKRLLPLLLFLTAVSPAATISVDPSTQSVSLGTSASVDVNVADLGILTAPSLSTYDIDVAFDPTILSFTGATFGDGLDLFLFGLNIQAATPGVGTVNLFDLSFDLPTDLDDLQADAFKLFTLTFDTIGPGTSPITLSVNAFGDSLGDPLDVTPTSGELTVTASVPEPSTIGLLLAGLLVIGRRRLTAR